VRVFGNTFAKFGKEIADFDTRIAKNGKVLKAQNKRFFGELKFKRKVHLTLVI